MCDIDQQNMKSISHVHYATAVKKLLLWLRLSKAIVQKIYPLLRGRKSDGMRAMELMGCPHIYQEHMQYSGIARSSATSTKKFAKSVY